MSLQGTLTTLGITEVLEFLAHREATGQLDITTEMGTASYLMSEGAVAQCEYSFIRESGGDSAEATYYIVSELDGTFFFDEDQEPIDTDGCEDVTSVLSRTAEIAEKWHEVEEQIATPNHLLVRNTELDGSVTIQPEWWKTLEIIGEGKTSLQLAQQTEQGLLSASLLVLDMTKAGLLNVEAIDPMSVEVPSIGEVAEVAEVDPVSPKTEMPSIEVEAAIPAAELNVEPLDAPQVPDVAEAVEQAPAPVAATPAAPAPVAEPVAAEGPPIPDAALLPQAAPAAVVAEPVVEPVAQTHAVFEAPAPVEAVSAFDTPLEAPAMPESNLAAAPVGNFEPAFVDPAPAPASAALAAEVAPAPAPAPAAPAAEVAPAPAPAPAAPAPAPAPVNEDDGWASDHSPSYDAAQSFETAKPSIAGLAPMPQAPTELEGAGIFASLPPEAEHESTAVAGEVLSDLATLSQMDEQPAGSENWALDDTFTPDAPAAPPADADPFGALDSLLEGEEEVGDEDRGSVLKFLRRD